MSNVIEFKRRPSVSKVGGASCTYYLVAYSVRGEEAEAIMTLEEVGELYDELQAVLGEAGQLEGGK